MTLRRLLLGGAALAAVGGWVVALPTPAEAQTVTKLCVPVVNSSSGIPVTSCQDVTAGAPLPVTGSFSASIAAFNPTGNASLSVSSASSSVALGSVGPTAVVQNTGATDAYVAFGGSGVTAATTDTLVRAGSTTAFNVGAGTFLASITASSTTTLWVTTGTGLPAVALAGASGGGGGTSSSFGAGFPATGTAIGVTDGTDMRALAGINYAGSSYSGAISVVQALPAGANVIGHVVADSGSTTAVTGNVTVVQPTAASLNATMVGTGTAGSPAGGLVTVQGTASMTRVLTTDSASNVPLNGSASGSNVMLAGGLLTTNSNASPLTLTGGGLNTNTAAVNGVTVLAGTGAVGTGAQRIAVGTDTATIAGSAPGTAGSASPQVVSVQGIASGTVLPVTATNLSSNVAQFGGSNVATGTGTGGSGIPRVTVSSDSTVGLVAGSALVGKVGIDQTTPGTTNAVQTTSGSVSSVTPATGTFAGCAGATEANTLTIPISQTTNTQIITGTASQKIRICAINLVTATTQNVSVIEGSGSTCGSSPLGLLSGGATAATGWNFVANQGIAEGNGQGVLARTTVNANNICVFQSSTGQVSGVITYVSF